MEDVIYCTYICVRVCGARAKKTKVWTSKERKIYLTKRNYFTWDYAYMYIKNANCFKEQRSRRTCSASIIATYLTYIFLFFGRKRMLYKTNNVINKAY